MESIIQPVAKIITSHGETGVGFLVDRCHLVTTLLLFPNEKTAVQASIQFYPNDDCQMGFTKSWQAKAATFSYDVERDLAILELEPDEKGRYAGDVWGHFQLAEGNCPVQSFEELTYIHYQEDDPVLESGQVLVTDTDENGWLQYYGCWLLQGSIGAPLLNKHMQVVGVHSRKSGPEQFGKKKGGKLPESWCTMLCSFEAVQVA